MLAWDQSRVPWVSARPRDRAQQWRPPDARGSPCEPGKWGGARQARAMLAGEMPVCAGNRDG